jgi:hypothetical protein
MDKGRVGEDRGSKETDECPLTVAPSIASYTCMVEVIFSTVLWYPLREKTANILNIYPVSLHLQYCFNTNNKQYYPFELTCKGNPNNLREQLSLKSNQGESKVNI